VWADNKGQPGRLMFVESSPDFKPVHLNRFFPYKLDSGILVSGRFYVGWMQVNENFLNVGFDLNNDNQARHFINISGTWSNSAYKGSLMIRPIFRTKNFATGINQITNNALPVKIYPNPARDIIFIDRGSELENESLVVSIYDITGKQVLQTTLQDNNINVSCLSSGLYIIRIAGKKTSLQPVKLLIQR
jgi:hypothetical protein